MASVTDRDVAAASIAALVDRDAIRDLANRYAHHVWHKEIEAVVDLFAVDGVLETPAMPPFRGRESLRQAFERMLEDDEFFPFVHNHVVDLDAGGAAASGTCSIDLRAVIAGQRLTAWGQYDDRYVRVDGTWKFARRTVRMASFVPLGEPLADNPQRTWEG